MRLIVLSLVASALVACQRNPEEAAVSDPSPPPATVFSRQQQSLDESLRDLDRELAAAMSGDLDSDEAKNRLQRAEAITDRLLESELPFQWLKSRDYSVEALIRQIQSLADRVIAKMRNGMEGREILTDVRELRRRTLELRRGLTLGGGPAPLSLDSLLAGYANDSTIVRDVGE